MVKVRDKSELITVDARENLKKLMAKNFVRPTKHSILLPYFDELEEEADKNFHHIINGMMAAFLTENAVAAADYTDMFKNYLHQFGLRMTKETFLNLIRFFYEVIIKEDQHIGLIMTACSGFVSMIKRKRPGSFGWRDLTLDWKPIYNLYTRATQKKIKPDISTELCEIIFYFAVFYHPEEHSNIWEIILEEITIGNNTFMEYFMSTCRFFLSVEGMTEEDIKKYGVIKWIDQTWDMYVKAEMNTSWSATCVDFISDLCLYTPGAYDLSRHFDILFTKMMRSFNLTVREGKVLVGCGQESLSAAQLAFTCAYTIGGPNSSLPHFERLMQYISINLHPLNFGEHTDQIASFLLEFITVFRSRLRNERLRYKKRNCSIEYYLNDSDIDKVTESITDLAIMLIFTINGQDNYQLLHILTTMNRDYVAPKLLEHLYSSLTAVSEPHRLTIIVEAFSTIVFEIIRQPDSEYRTPRDKIFDSMWLILLEEQRKDWPSYRPGSDVPEIKSHRFRSLRAHAFYIMEILINNINVSDVDRTSYIIKTLVVLFSSIPLMDFSSAIKLHGNEMSEDDKILCLLSKRIPHLVEYTMEKILEVITCMSVVIPKTSAARMSMSNESEHQDGDEEVVLKSGISQLVNVIFERVDENIRKRLFDRLFNYLTTAEFANFSATETLSTLVESAVWVNRDAFRHYAEFISKKLKSLITGDVQKSKTPSSSVLFYVSLARPLFSATHKLVLENEPLLFEIIQLLLKCESENIHKCGTFGVNSLLLVLLTMRTEDAASLENGIFSKPLNEWNPVKYWARCIHYKETLLKWYIPAKQEIECAQRIANKFFFPYIEKLMTKEYDRDTFRLIINHIMTVMRDIKIFQHPESVQKISDIYTPSCLPLSSSSLGNSCTLQYELKGPNGENAREMLLTMVEHVFKKTQDPFSLIRLANIADGLLGKMDYRHADIESALNSFPDALVDPIYSNITKASQQAMEKLAFLKHTLIQSYHQSEIRYPNDFDERIMNCLIELALNDYKKVQNESTAFLKSNLKQIWKCRQIFIRKVIQVLTDETLNNMDRLAGAMNLMLEMGFILELNPKIRLEVWDAVLRIKVVDDFKVCTLFDEICKVLQSMSMEKIPRMSARVTHKDRNTKVAQIANKLIKDSELWKPFLTEESLKNQFDMLFDHEESRNVSRIELVEMLFKKHIHNSNHHHTRENLARTMAYFTQKDNIFDERTIVLLLSQLNDEHYHSRKEARKWLAYWFYKNKPKSMRMNIPAPKRIDHGVSLESGIREDNLWLVYDSENLPKTEDKWNEMIFVEKQKGACRWPKTMSLVRKRKDGDPLETKPITPIDRLIIDHFSQPDFITHLLENRLIEKEDHTAPNEYFYKICKYVIRNYPNVTKPLELLTQELKQLLRSKNKNEQLLASELLIGIVKGLKHKSFIELECFWKDITVRLDRFFNILILEAETEWSTAMSCILSGDVRRHWWLLESLIDGAKKSTASTEFHQAFRLTTINFKRWQYGEIMKRVNLIAWGKLNSTFTDSLRYAIARVFRSTAQICETNSTATFINVPSRFIPESLDSTIQNLIKKIPKLKLNEEQEPKKNCKPDTVLSSPPKKKRKRSLSADSKERISLIYFRTLLETIIQFYDYSMQSWTPTLVQILPKLMEYANEDDYDLSEETYRDVDITQYSAFIVNDHMSVTWLRNEFMDCIVSSWHKTFSTHSESWRVRMAVIKFVQASVYSNMYAMCVESRRNQIEKLLFEAIFDREISVRKETAKCLLLFIHCEYIHISDEKVTELSRILLSDSEAKAHGAALALGAFTLAYPFSLPIKILKPLRILSSSTSKRDIVQKTMTECVREFRRQHRDDWIKTKNILGESLVFDIENATAPPYYA